MALTQHDIEAIRGLIQSEKRHDIAFLAGKLRALREDFDRFQRETQQHFEALLTISETHFGNHASLCRRLEDLERERA